jgi:hypothetical protein
MSVCSSRFESAVRDVDAPPSWQQSSRDKEMLLALQMDGRICFRATLSEQRVQRRRSRFGGCAAAGNLPEVS